MRILVRDEIDGVFDFDSYGRGLIGSRKQQWRSCSLRFGMVKTTTVKTGVICNRSIRHGWEEEIEWRIILDGRQIDFVILLQKQVVILYDMVRI